MGLLRFFEIQRNYADAPDPGPKRSDFVIQKDKNGRQYAYWVKGNSAGERAGKQVSPSQVFAEVERGRDARGAQFIRKCLGVSASDAAAIWAELKANPRALAETLGPKGESVVKSPIVSRK